MLFGRRPHYRSEYQALHIYMIVCPSSMITPYSMIQSGHFSSLTLGKERKAASKIIDLARPKTQWMAGPL